MRDTPVRSSTGTRPAIAADVRNELAGVGHRRRPAGIGIVQERDSILRPAARPSGFEPGFPPQQALRDGTREPDPLVLDDQALIVHVRDGGLVVNTACGGRALGGPDRVSGWRSRWAG